MSFDNGSYQKFSFPAGADLSASQYLAVKVDSAGAVVLAGAGEMVVGILQNDPAQGQAATVCYGGVSKAKLGGTVTAGATVAANASGAIVDAGEARTNTSDAGAASDPLIGSNVIGVALAGGAAGDIVPVLITLSGAVPTTAA